MQLTGCAAGTQASAPDLAAGAAMVGHVHGGQQPVTNATVALYVTTSAGYGGAPSLLASTKTLSDGSFNITSSYNCPAGQYAYVLAYGGNPGLGGTVNNTSMMMMAALGPCANLPGMLVDIDEVTTVAAVYGLSGFMPAGAAGFAASGVTAGVSTSATNTQGMGDAFANATNVVNNLTGQAYTATPTSGSNGVVPQATINSLADIVQDCVNSTGAVTAASGTTAATPCYRLFTNATPPAGSGVAAPTTTLQALYDIATYPGNNVGALYNSISPNAAFLPNLGTAPNTGVPNDWTLGVTYTSPQLNAAGATTTGSPSGLTIDATDNVWVSGATNASLVEFSPLGVALSPAVGSGANGQGGWTPSITTNAFAMGSPVTTANNVRNVAFDPAGNIWLTDGGATQIYEYTPAGTATAPSAGTLATQSYGAVNTDGNNYDLAIDASGDIWTTTYKQNTCGTTTKLCAFVEFAKSGGAYTAQGGFPAPGGTVYTQPSGARGMAANAKAGSAGLGDIWATNNNGNTVQIFQAPYTAAPVVATVGTATTVSPYGVSLDAGGNGWVTGGTTNQLFQVGRTGTVLATVPSTGSTAELNKPFYLAIDGNGNIFVANSFAPTGTPAGGPFTGYTPGAGTVAEYSPSQGAFLSPNTGFAPGATYNSSTASAVGGPINNDAYVAVDRAGALWVLSGGAAGVTYTPAGGSAMTTPAQPANLVQILGVAAPTNPTQAAGQYGVKP